MCGIAGVINYQDLELNKILQALMHRGPDAKGIFTDHHVALIQTRLAIQDIENGVQPFHYENYSMVYNGEIYNHLGLRKCLPEFNFQTNSDTETLLKLYIKYKEKMFEMLDGMFAFCIFDKTRQQLILARDRAGKKPLYYYQNKDCFIFASELNAIKAVMKLGVNVDAINCYLRTGLIWQPYTAYHGVYELPAANYLVIDVKNLKRLSYSYFNILDYYQAPSLSLSFSEQVDQLEQKLYQSISDRIMASDVEVGIFLSGGIDSNLIAALAARIKPNIKTFTVKFDGLYDESKLAKLAAQQYQTNHIELTIANNLSQDIEKILCLYGEPFMDSSAIPSFYVSREARNHVKVVLSGDGADELFAGYRRYVATTNYLRSFIKCLAPLSKILPKPHTKQSLYNYLYRLIAISNKRGLDYYLSATTDIFEDVWMIKESPITNKLGNFINDIFNNKQLSFLKKFLYLDFNIILFCDLLIKMDIASMANSLEVRSPFLSKYLLEFAPRLHDQYKLKGIKTKYILKKLAEKYVPYQLVKQPKRGFEVPLKKWIDYDLHEKINDRLKPGNFSENFVDRNFIQGLLEKKITLPSEKRAKILWSLYCLEVWHQNDT